MLFNKLNAVCCNCIIGRGAEFGPEFVLLHATGVVINGKVRGGRGVTLEHQVTIGADRRETPVLGDDVFIGAGAKVIGPVSVGSGARVGANAVVVHDVPAHSTVVGIPARVVRQRRPPGPESTQLADGNEVANSARQPDCSMMGRTGFPPCPSVPKGQVPAQFGPEAREQTAQA
jgi:serine O-acetyltransferase